MNHDELRAFAAMVAFPDTGLTIWHPRPTPIPAREPAREPRWSVERCAEILGCEPSGAENWRPLAACKGTAAELFYPELHESAKPGKSVCLTCPVRAECLAFALNAGERHGIWGSLSVRDRQALVRDRSSRVRLTVQSRQTRRYIAEKQRRDAS